MNHPLTPPPTMAKNKPSKRYRQALEMVDPAKEYPIDDALNLLGKFPAAKFNETVEVSFRLGVDPRKSDQMVRGTVSLPNGSGKEVRVVVFTKPGPGEDQAKEAGAEYVGFEDLIEKVKGGWNDFDVAVATPEAMLEVRKLGKVLGPRGLMPNPKTGTVTNDVADAVKQVKAGRVEFKVDKTSNLHVVVGKRSFSNEQLGENLRAVLDVIGRAKPSSSKGRFIRSCTIASTMSPPVSLDLREVSEVTA
jgi:large subunit ribosomal protein L1